MCYSEYFECLDKGFSCHSVITAQVLSGAMQNTNKRKTSRQVQRSVNAQIFAENAAALAHLSQQQDGNECLEDDDTSENADNIYVKRRFISTDDGSEGVECSTSGILSTDFSPEPKQTTASSFELHQDSDEDNIHENSINYCSNYGGKEVGSDRNHSNETSNDSQFVAESDSSEDESDAEVFIDNCTAEEPDKIETFSVKQHDVSPEVWRLIKGEAEEKTQEEIFNSELAQWSMKYRVKRNALDDLLHLLRDHGHPDLPASAKTLLKTPRSTTNIVKALAGGQFWYRGIVNALLTCLTDEYVQSLQNNTVEVEIFVDGLSPHKKAKRSIWPIAGCVKGQKTPFVIALWCGSSKEPTSVHEFFEDFLNESADLIANGFLCHGRKMKFSIRRYLADAPARAWIKQVKPHNSYSSCERCTIVGEWKFRRMTYNPSEECTLRTDESFENQCDEAHHIGESPLLRLGTRIISQVPIDVMHLVYLGVSKRLHSLLLRKKAGRFKLPEGDVKKLDSLCIFLYKFCPCEFASKPRPISQYKLYKATEWRRVLLYDGFLINKSHRHKEVYECYLLVACGMRILLDSELRSQFMDDAHLLFVNFVKRCYRVLGCSFVVYNVHHLLHLVSECILHGDPEDFSCFMYENYLGQLKGFLAAPGRSLQQIICRLIERALAPAVQPVTAPRQVFKQPHSFGPKLDCHGQQFTIAYFEGFVIRVARENPRDAFVLMSSRKVVVVENIVESNSNAFIIGREFLNMSNFFTFPMPSSLLNIFKVSNLGPLKKWSKCQIMKKVSYFPLVNDGDFDNFNWREDEGLCIPILHSEV